VKTYHPLPAFVTGDISPVSGDRQPLRCRDRASPPDERRGVTDGVEGGVDPQPLKSSKTAHLLPDKLCVFLTGKEDIAQQELDLGLLRVPVPALSSTRPTSGALPLCTARPRKELGDLGRPAPTGNDVSSPFAAASAPAAFPQ